MGRSITEPKGLRLFLTLREAARRDCLLPMRSYKRHAKHSGKKHGKHGRSYSIHNPDFKIVAMGAAAGVATLLVGGFATTNFKSLSEYWYAVPAGAMVASALLLKKMPTVAIGIAGAGGLLLYMGYMGNRAMQEQAAADAKAKPAAGMDAGYWRQGYALGPQMRRDSGLFERRNAGAFLGEGAQAMVQSQSGALLGDASHTIRREQATGVAAGSMYRDAMGLEG